MFRQTWNKYLPVITILMKRSSGGDQVLSMNHTDFEKAAGGKKIKFSFAKLMLENGRMDYYTRQTALATDLVLVLQENDQTSKLMQHRQFEISMNNEYQLIIKNKTTKTVTPDVNSLEENVAANEAPQNNDQPENLPLHKEEI
jgi:hypothetical protein